MPSPVMGGGSAGNCAAFSVTSPNGGGNAVSASTTNFAAFGPAASGTGGETFSATESARQTLAPCGGTIKNLYVRTNATQDASGTLNFELRVNGVSTAVTVVVPAGGAAGVYSSGALSAGVSAGDLIGLLIANNATVTSAGVTHWGVVIQ